MSFTRLSEECLKKEVKTTNAIVQVTEKNKAEVTIYDLVLPLPGYDVTFGDGFSECETKTREAEFLSRPFDICFASFQSRTGITSC